MLKFVAGHDIVVQPASINIVFECKQAQQYSRAHHLRFIRAVSWSAQNAESHWSHVHTTLTVKHFSFHVFLYNVLVTARLFKSLNVTKTTNIFLAHLRFLKKLQIFLMLLGIIIHAAPPLPKSTLISSYQRQKHLA